MAHVISIPLAFEFRPLRAKWCLRAVEIEGWAKDVRRRSLIGYIGSSDDVTVEVLEPGEPDGLVGIFGMLNGPRGFSDLKRPARVHWSDIPTEIKATATPAKNMEKIRGDIFHVLACESSESAYGRTGDAWAMRREFLRLKQDSWALLEFLRKWGIWDERRLGLSNLEPGANASIQNVVFPEGIWDLQTAYRTALVGPPHEWLSKGVDPFKGAYATPMYPHFILEHYHCKLAIEATITIDLLRKVKFRKCKRPDCSEVFALESAHKRIYCCQPCAHLESVRKQRRAAAKQKKKSKSRKGA
jgi:hypothetical protein